MIIDWYPTSWSLNCLYTIPETFRLKCLPCKAAIPAIRKRYGSGTDTVRNVYGIHFGRTQRYGSGTAAVRHFSAFCHYDAGMDGATTAPRRRAGHDFASLHAGEKETAKA